MDDRLLEGATTLSVPAEAGAGRGPGRIEADRPFFNAAMALNRDLSVAIVEAFARQKGREVDFAECLAGTGARSARIAKEADAPVIVHANDGDPAAVAAIEATAADNGVSDRVRAYLGHAHGFLAARRYDIVDVDPFGSPMPFLDMAVHATRHDGLVCVTATDTGALCGTYPKACRRRYGAEPVHVSSWRAEAGLRIMQACVVRAAGRRDRWAAPVMAVARGHWMRVVMRIRDGRKGADDAARRIGSVSAHPLTGQGLREGTGGPLWWGPLHEPAFMDSLRMDRALGDPATAGLVDALRAEADATPFWVPLQELPARMGGDSMPRRKDFQGALRDGGATVWPSHMDPLGVRTDATPDAVAAAWRSLL